MIHLQGPVILDTIEDAVLYQMPAIILAFHNFAHHQHILPQILTVILTFWERHFAIIQVLLWQMGALCMDNILAA